jgi:hypothetical protein
MVGVFSEGISCGLESEIVQLIQGARVVAFGWAWEESYETDSNLHKYTLTPLSNNFLSLFHCRLLELVGNTIKYAVLYGGGTSEDLTYTYSNFNLN